MLKSQQLRLRGTVAPALRCHRPGDPAGAGQAARAAPRPRSPRPAGAAEARGAAMPPALPPAPPAPGSALAQRLEQQERGAQPRGRGAVKSHGSDGRRHSRPRRPARRGTGTRHFRRTAFLVSPALQACGRPRNSTTNSVLAQAELKELQLRPLLEAQHQGAPGLSAGGDSHGQDPHLGLPRVWGGAAAPASPSATGQGLILLLHASPATTLARPLLPKGLQGPSCCSRLGWLSPISPRSLV